VEFLRAQKHKFPDIKTLSHLNTQQGNWNPNSTGLLNPTLVAREYEQMSLNSEKKYFNTQFYTYLNSCVNFDK
jgi:hypothetical protein